MEIISEGSEEEGAKKIIAMRCDIFINGIICQRQYYICRSNKAIAICKKMAVRSHVTPTGEKKIPVATVE